MESRYRGDPINEEPYVFPIEGEEPVRNEMSPDFDGDPYEPPFEEEEQQVFSMDATWSVLTDEEKTEPEEDDDEAFTIKPFQISEG